MLGVRSFADMLGCPALVDATNKFIQKHFLEVSQSDEFLALPLPDTMEIAGWDEIHVTSEEQVNTRFSKLRDVVSY